MRFHPEVALTRLQLAELLLEHYPEEKSEALDILHDNRAEHFIGMCSLEAMPHKSPWSRRRR